MLSLAITTYNRTYHEIESSFLEAVFLSGIDEIIIVDDYSPMHVYADICSELRQKKFYKHKSILLYRNNRNLGMAANKKHAVSLCKNDWIILFDSDNHLRLAYIEACMSINKKPGTIYCPSKAMPHFDYSHFIGTINKENVKEKVNQSQFDCLINTCNYLVPKEEFLSVCHPDPEIDAADSALFFYQWMASGRTFEIVDGMEYNHTVHQGSGFLQNVEKNIADVKKIIEKIKLL